MGVHVTSHWNADLDNPANKAFVEAFQKAYNRIPTNYAAQGYDTALAIASALRQTGGKVDNTEAFRAGMEAKTPTPDPKAAAVQFLGGWFVDLGHPDDEAAK